MPPSEIPRTVCGPAVTVVSIARVYGCAAGCQHAGGGLPQPPPRGHAIASTVRLSVSPSLLPALPAPAGLVLRLSEHVLVLATGRAGDCVRAVRVAAGAAPDLGARDLQHQVPPAVDHRRRRAAQAVDVADRPGREVP